MKKNYNYPDEKSIKSIDDVLNTAIKVLQTNEVVIKDQKNIPPVFGATLSAGAITGSGIMTGSGASVVGGSLLGGPITVVPVVFGLGVFQYFRNKKKKKLRNMKLTRFREAVMKQNKIIAKHIELDKIREQREKQLKAELDNNAKEISELRSKLNELRAINEALLGIIKKLDQDFILDKAA